MVLIVGKTEIEYTTRQSAKAKRLRIVVTPDKVEVVVPKGKSPEDVEKFVQSKRKWIYTKREELQELARAGDSSSIFITGAKILHRGRRMRLTVTTAATSRVFVEYRNGFEATVPEFMPGQDREKAVASAVEQWQKDRLLSDAEKEARRIANKLGQSPTGIRIKKMKGYWGSCGQEGIIHLDHHLIEAPYPVFEYVVVHEMCHLIHRDHSRKFWTLVGQMMPDYEDAKKWLKAKNVKV